MDWLERLTDSIVPRNDRFRKQARRSLARDIMDEVRPQIEAAYQKGVTERFRALERRNDELYAENQRLKVALRGMH